MMESQEACAKLLQNAMITCAQTCVDRRFVLLQVCVA